MSPRRALGFRTTRLRSLNEADLLDDEVVVVAADATETRARLPLWSNSDFAASSRAVYVRHIDADRVQIDSAGRATTEVSLRDADGLRSALTFSSVLLDISGLLHHVWAPVLRSLLASCSRVRVLYCEPGNYRRHESPASATTFDLSESFDDVGPLPGFANLTGPVDETQCVLIASLGFEGSRPENLLTQLSPTPMTIPLVGFPGFQIEYPAFTVDCNRDFLSRSQSYAEIRLARASCPFEAFSAVEQVAKDHPGSYLYLAPVGTKPHALGLVLYAIRNPGTTEIVYDHPKKKPGRTTGVGLIHLYDLCDFNAL